MAYRVIPPGRGVAPREAALVPGSPAAAGPPRSPRAVAAAAAASALQAEDFADAVLCDMIAADAEVAAGGASFARPTVADMARRYHILRDTLRAARGERSSSGGAATAPRARWRSPTSPQPRARPAGGSGSSGGELGDGTRRFKVRVHGSGEDGAPAVAGVPPPVAQEAAATAPGPRAAAPANTASRRGSVAADANARRGAGVLPVASQSARAGAAPSQRKPQQELAQRAGSSSSSARPGSASTYTASIRRVVPSTPEGAKAHVLPAEVAPPAPVTHEGLFTQQRQPPLVHQQQQYAYTEAPHALEGLTLQAPYHVAPSPHALYATASPDPHRGGSGHIVLGFSEVVSMLGRVTGDVLTQVLGGGAGGGRPATAPPVLVPQPAPQPLLPPPAYAAPPLPVRQQPAVIPTAAAPRGVTSAPPSRGSSTGALSGRGSGIASRGPSPSAPSGRPPFLPPGSTTTKPPLGGSRTSAAPVNTRFVDPALGDALARLHALEHGRAPLDVTGFLRRAAPRRAPSSGSGEAAAGPKVSVAVPAVRPVAAKAAASAPPKWLDLSMEASDSSGDEAPRVLPSQPPAAAGRGVRRSGPAAAHETARLVAAADALLLETTWAPAPPLAHLPPVTQPAVAVAPVPVASGVAHGVAAAQDAALAAARQALLAYQCV